MYVFTAAPPGGQHLTRTQSGIHDNIPAFGGDSNNVVAMGQSVGAMAVGLHLVSFGGSQGVPFQKAMYSPATHSKNAVG